MSLLAAYVSQLRTSPAFGWMEAMPEGAEVYLVGGAVRDILLGKAGDLDLDLLVRGVPVERLQECIRPYGKVELVGKRFGVLKFFPKGERRSLDIALPRTERAGGSGGRNDFAVQSDPFLPLAEDLSRRDFTINAIAVNVVTNEITDPYNGVADLAARLLRAVGDPVVRFAEDHSRLLRALRFAVTCDLIIDPGTSTVLLEQLRNTLPNALGSSLPYELASREFVRSLVADPVRTLQLWEQAGALDILIPEFAPLRTCIQGPYHHSEGDVWTHTQMVMGVLASEAHHQRFGIPGPTLLCAALCHDIGKPAARNIRQTEAGEDIDFYGHSEAGAQIWSAVAKRLRLAAVGVDVDLVSFLISHHMVITLSDLELMSPTEFCDLFLDRKGEFLESLYVADMRGRISQVPDLEERIEAKLKQIAGLRGVYIARGADEPALLDGARLMEIARLSAGPQVGVALTRLRDLQLQGSLSTAAEAEQYVRDHLDQFTS